MFAFAVFVPDSIRQCNMKCGKNKEMICGSNGKVYQNFCLLKQDACINKVKIIKHSDGKRKENDSIDGDLFKVTRLH